MSLSILTISHSSTYLTHSKRGYSDPSWAGRAIDLSRGGFLSCAIARFRGDPSIWQSQAVSWPMGRSILKDPSRHIGGRRGDCGIHLSKDLDQVGTWAGQSTGYCSAHALEILCPVRNSLGRNVEFIEATPLDPGCTRQSVNESRYTGFASHRRAYDSEALNKV